MKTIIRANVGFRSRRASGQEKYLYVVHVYVNEVLVITYTGRASHLSPESAIMEGMEKVKAQADLAKHVVRIVDMTGMGDSKDRLYIPHDHDETTLPDNPEEYDVMRE